MGIGANLGPSTVAVSSALKDRTQQPVAPVAGAGEQDYGFRPAQVGGKGAPTPMGGKGQVKRYGPPPAPIGGKGNVAPPPSQPVAQEPMFDQFTSQAEFDRARGIETASQQQTQQTLRDLIAAQNRALQQQYIPYQQPFFSQPQQFPFYQPSFGFQPMSNMQYGQQFPMQGFGMQNQFQSNPYVNPSYFQGRIPNMPMQQQAPSLMSFISGKGQR